MAVNWSLYETLLNLSGSTALDARSIEIKESANMFIEDMKTDPAYQKSATVEGVTMPIAATCTSAKICEFKAVPGSTIHIGDIVKCFSRNWIVVDVYQDVIGIVKGTMWLCNDTVKFQNRSATIFVRNCVMDDGSYGKNTDNDIVFVPENTYKMYIPMDTDTKQLFIDKRLSFGSIYDENGNQVLEVYRIVGIDRKTKNVGNGSHIMIVTLQRDVYNETTDSLADNICDVYVSSSSAAVTASGGKCLITGKEEIRIGTSRKFAAAFYNTGGAAESDVEAAWTVSAVTGVTHTVSGTNNKYCTVSIPMKENLIGTEITIGVSEATGAYGSYQKKVRVIAVG